VTVGSGDNKHREWWSLGTADKELAKRKAMKLIAELDAGARVTSSPAEVPASEIVDDFVEAHFAHREARGVVMVQDERMYYRTRIKEAIGSMYLCDVKPSHIRVILDEAAAAGVKRLTLVAIRSLLHRIFKAAWTDELIETNPVDRVETPKLREVVKQRVILTDEEFGRLMASTEVTDLELKMAALLARTLGEMRTSDLTRWDWSMIDTREFITATIPRSKTGRPDVLEVPEVVRHILRTRWEAHGQPTNGPVFPLERGRHAGEFRMRRGTSYAERLRRELFAAGVVRLPPVEVPYVKPGTRTDLGKVSTQPTRMAPNPYDPLYFETATSLPVDFHSFRRAFNTALADAGVNVQQAMRLAGHSDPKVHMRYVQQTEKMRRVPISALPASLVVIGGN
jgi:integrase